MQVILADKAGFCYGVKRALEMALGACQEGGPWYTLGPLVHNREVADFLRSQGLEVKEGIDEVEAGGVIIRSHGAGPEVYGLLQERGLKVIDATCPRVARVQRLARQMTQEGYRVVVVGDRNHPEVIGIIGWAQGQAVAVSSGDEAKSLPFASRSAVVCQTTKAEEDFLEVLIEVAKLSDETRAFNTLCEASTQRQKAAIQLAGQVDLMVVVGDRTSANTRSLVKACAKRGVPTYQVENPRELDPLWFKGVLRVGVTAGASTPDWLIKEVVDRMVELGSSVAELEENAVEETLVSTGLSDEVGDVKGAAAANERTEGEVSFAEMEAEMVQSIKEVERGMILKGKVIQVTDNEVMVDVGGKSEGIIPLRELTSSDIASAHEVVKVGDEFEVQVLRWDDDGTILLSKRRVDQEKALDNLQECFAEDKAVTGKVQKVVKGGLLVDVGILGFLPASQIEEGYAGNLEQYLGQELSCKIIEFNKNKKRGSQVVLSRRKLLQEEKELAKKRFWEEVKEGQIRTGRVKRITDYGAFIDIGGFEGLLHISEMDHARVSKPSDVLQEGQEIEVYVLAADPETQRVSLSRKKVLRSPWETVAERYEPGQVVRGKVVRIASFGAFVELEPGVDGLIHISQLADRRVSKVEDVVAVGDEVQVKVLAVEPDKRRISLSLREAEQEVDSEFAREYLEKQDIGDEL